jgi:hypothetical protein
MGLLDTLLGGGSQRQQCQDFVQRYDQERPWEGGGQAFPAGGPGPVVGPRLSAPSTLGESRPLSYGVSAAFLRHDVQPMRRPGAATHT